MGQKLQDRPASDINLAQIVVHNRRRLKQAKVCRGAAFCEQPDKARTWLRIFVEASDTYFICNLTTIELNAIWSIVVDEANCFFATQAKSNWERKFILHSIKAHIYPWER